MTADKRFVRALIGAVVGVAVGRVIGNNVDGVVGQSIGAMVATAIASAVTERTNADVYDPATKTTTFDVDQQSSFGLQAFSQAIKAGIEEQNAHNLGQQSTVMVQGPEPRDVKQELQNANDESRARNAYEEACWIVPSGSGRT